jgi:hypothetical protein
MHTIEANIGSRLVKSLSAVVASGVWLFATTASASTSYWAELSNPAGAYAFKGDCTLCHTDNAGGKDTVTRAFGINLMDDYGLGGDDVPKFKEVMALVAAEGLDTDGDSATDIDEIVGGGNPNDPEVLPGGFEPPVQPEFGCVGTIAGNTPSTDGTALTAAVLAALVLVFKRRR